MDHPPDSRLAVPRRRGRPDGPPPDSRFRLTGEIIALSHPDPDTGDRTVIVVQRWEGAPGRATLITVRDGQIVDKRARGGVAAVDGAFTRATRSLRDLVISEADARALLTAKGVAADYCRCGDLLPIGLWRCKACGLSIGQQTSGRSSGAARRGDITFPHPGGTP